MSHEPNSPSTQLVQRYFSNNYRVVFWPAVGDAKGPSEKGWTDKQYTLNDYHDGYRVGLLTGVEVAPGRFLHDVDIDWGEGSYIAQAMLPPTGFVFGRPSKKISHCFYTLPEPLHSFRYDDPFDKTCLIEIRGTKLDGSIGLQTMAPPSVWSKGNKKEPLAFVRGDAPAHLESSGTLKQRVTLAAIGMLLAKYFSHNGFGHEPKLAWAGFLLRAGVDPEDLIRMGESMAPHTNDLDSADVRRVVESTLQALMSTQSKKVKGGPALIKCIGVRGGPVVRQINRWLGRDSDFHRHADGSIIRNSQENINRALQQLNMQVSYQEFAERLLISDETGGTPKLLDDYQCDHLWLRVDRECLFQPTQTFFRTALTDLAHESAFHPVRDYLRGLTWDGEPRIDHWLVKYGGVDDPHPDSSEQRSYVEAVSSIVLIAAVRRILHPGCKYDEMLVLESEQGMNKSSALRILAVQDDWFSDDLPLNVDAKQIIERTLGKWIIEASDLVGGRKADRDHLKSMLSRQIDGPARMAYGRTPVERARQFVIIGTTNSRSYLEDMTGARRFWPVKVHKFDLIALEKDRDQLWAEAVIREGSGESIRLSQELWSQAGEQQEARREVDAWEEVLTSFVADRLEISHGWQKVTAEGLWTTLGIPVERRDRYGAKRISEIMQRMGFERRSVRDGDRVLMGYARRGEGEIGGAAREKAPDEPGM
jgi:hypothetical protein